MHLKNTELKFEALWQSSDSLKDIFLQPTRICVLLPGKSEIKFKKSLLSYIRPIHKLCRQLVHEWLRKLNINSHGAEITIDPVFSPKWAGRIPVTSGEFQWYISNAGIIPVLLQSGVPGTQGEFSKK